MSCIPISSSRNLAQINIATFRLPTGKIVENLKKIYTDMTPEPKPIRTQTPAPYSAQPA